MEIIKNYIDGELVEPIAKRYLDNINPATETAYSKVPLSDRGDVNRAVASATRAFKLWSEKSKEERAAYLYKIAELILKHSEELSLAETTDNGKPIKVSRAVDIPRSAENFKFFADQSLKFSGKSLSDEGRGKNTVIYSPLGPVGVISPWNLPLYLLTWKIAPALASGCTVVAKPSEVTPMTAYLLGKIFIEADLPPGVVNIVHGDGVETGEALTCHPDIKAISFTGSTAVGRKIAVSAAQTLKKIQLEMGGKNPTIVFEDCNFENAVEMTLKSAFSNQGQICLCGSRIFVEKSIYPQFKNALIEKINKLKVGTPEDSQTDQGALVSKAHFEKIKKALAKAREEGGIFLTGGSEVSIPEKGFFIAPTLIEGLPYHCQTNQEEIFGPVATIMPFENEDDVLKWANSTPYGLSASVWTQDQAKANRIASKLEVGMVWINSWMVRDLRTPFGGQKLSGFGKEGGDYILEFFSQIKNICNV